MSSKDTEVLQCIYYLWAYFIRKGLLLFHPSVMPDSLRPHGLQHARFPYPSLSPRICSGSCSLNWSCYLVISSSAALFFFCLQSLKKTLSSLEKTLILGKIESKRMPTLYRSLYTWNVILFLSFFLIEPWLVSQANSVQSWGVHCPLNQDSLVLVTSDHEFTAWLSRAIF